MYPNNNLSTPSVNTYSDPTAVNPWHHGANNFTLTAATSPVFNSVITAIGGTGCNVGDLYLTCGPGSATYNSNSSCAVSSCSASGQVTMTVTSSGGNYTVTITE